MKLLCCLFLLLSIGSTSAQQIIPLNQFSSQFDAIIATYQAGASLYITSNDNDDQLRNIIINNGGELKNAYQLNRLHSPAGMKTPWPLNVPTISVKNRNNDTVTRIMTGAIYITTAAQAKDENFLVYDVTDKLFIDRTLSPKSTLVFMNVYLWNRQIPQMFMPQWSSYVSGVKHAQTSPLTIFRDIPPANYVVERENSKVFSNPLVASLPTKTELFFANIEPLQILPQFWYLTCDGGISLTVEGKWVNTPIYNATAGTTTGLLTTDDGYVSNTTINFAVTPGMNATSGFLINYDLFEPIKLEMTTMDGASESLRIDNPNPNYWNTTRMDRSSFQATTFSVTSHYTIVGKYYIQYYKSEYPTNPTSTSVIVTTQTSPSPIATTPTTQTSPSPIATTPTPANGGTTSISTSTVQTTTNSASRFTTILTFFTFLISYYLY